jgi:hypothetical protein
MPGIFVCICGEGEGCGAGDRVGDDEGLAGIFIPGMLLIWLLFSEFFWAGVLFLPDAAFRRCLPDVFIPGILLMSCFLVGRLFRTTLRFLGAAFRVAFDLAFGIFIPGMFCMSLP